jgi:hypothetical protein
MLAVETLDVDMMQFLLAHGADPLLPAKANVTSLMLASGLGNRDEKHIPEQKKNARWKQQNYWFSWVRM